MCGCQGGQMRKLDGKCTDMSLCILSDYCVHGTCLNTTLIPTCVCESGYTGLRCDNKTVHQNKYCNGKLCNHGVCVGTFCLCDMGWEGELCDSLQQCQDGYSTFSQCYPYDKDVTFDLCPIDTIRNCHTCWLYPFTKSGVICDITSEGENHTNIRLQLIDGSFVERINKDHDEKLGGCFPPDSLVIGVNNKTIKMKSLRVGETILTVDAHGRYTYTKVILMFHNDSKGKLKYRKIVTENGHSIEISLEHLIYTAKRRNDKIEVKAAGNIKEGDFIHVFDKYRGYTKAARVVRISEEVKTGLYAPLTETGNLIVDDHLVSSYATYEDQDIVHLMFLPWRLAFKFNAWMWDQEPYWPIESGAHWSLKGFFMFANLRCYLFNEEYCEYMNF
ncbi:uncharacterized protein LOC134693433 [Mytilus trossulus]|uniref:uncharacterized protein LOC134693433 n=1 Tax=Mytilus trossulus TaxID=6551 RepID=UPI003004C6DD